MGVTEWVAIAGAALTIAGSLGGIIRWAGAQFKAQGTKLAKLEGEYAELYRDQSLTLVRLERFRLAFQLVASELQRRAPGNVALVHAAALLNEGFKIEPDLTEEMQDLLREMDQRTEAAGES